VGWDHCTEMPGRKPELPCPGSVLSSNLWRHVIRSVSQVCPADQALTTLVFSDVHLFPMGPAGSKRRGTSPMLLPPQGEVAGEPGGGVPRGGEGGGRGGGEVDREGTCRLIGSCMAFMAESPADDRLGISGRAAEN